MAPTAKWKKLKAIISGESPLKKLRSFNPESLKNLRNKKGKSLLHVAAKHASLMVNKYFIHEIGLDKNLEDKKNGYTPLTYALRSDDTRSKNLVFYLIECGVDVSFNKIKIQPEIFFKHRGICENFFSSVKYYEDYSSSAAAGHLIKKGWTLDHIACMQNDPNITRGALKCDETLNDNYKKLLNAVTQQDVDQVKLLFELIAHSKRASSWALLEIAKIRSPKSPIFVKFMLDKGVLINGFLENDTTPLVGAMMRRNIDNSWILLDHGASFGNFKVPREKMLKLSEQQKIEESLFAEDCIRLLIEHRGVCNYQVPNLDEIAQLTDFERWHKGYNLADRQFCERICIEYKLIQCHLMQQDYAYIVDNFHFSDELKKMKNYQIVDSINLWDILEKTIDQMIPFTKNNSFMNKIKSQPFLKMFPRYSITLQFKVNKASQKRVMIDHSVKVLSKCLPPAIGSCLLVLKKVVRYLGVPNLLSLEKE